MITGKGLYTWQLARVEGGDPGRIVQAAAAAGLGHVLIKVADGAGPYNAALAAQVANGLRTAGIQVLAWQYVYGYQPEAEADMALKRIREIGGCEAFIVNAEAEYKQRGRASAAEIYMARLRKGLPDTPIGLSSYRYPSYHPIPWAEFLRGCDLVMPQVYWMQEHNPVYQLDRTIEEYNRLLNELDLQMPMLPTGAAFAERGWQASPGEVQLFLQRAEELGFSAVNFWSWDAINRDVPEIWPVIAQFPWAGLPTSEDPAPEPDPVEETEMSDAQYQEMVERLDDVNERLNAVTERLDDITERLDSMFALLLGADLPEPQPQPDPEPHPEPTPAPIASVVEMAVKAEKTVARYIKSRNAKGKPIMEIYGPVNERVRFDKNESVSVIDARVTADGGSIWYELASEKGKNGEELFLAAADLKKS